METSAQFILKLQDDGPAYSAVGDIYTILASGEQTGGTHTLLTAMVLPGGGPPLHFHRREDESFLVLEGELTFTVDGKTVLAKDGSFVQLPRGSRHAFKNTGTRPARALILCVPAGFDQFMKEFAHPLSSRHSPPVPVTEADLQKLLALAPKYGIEILPPA